ncbi:FliH/SctL family protein [Sphingomonas gilva]|nr:FliH/SctL family protein [Sphingomonas gilva]
MSSLWSAAERVTPTAIASGALAGFAPWSGGEAVAAAPIRLDPREAGYREGLAEGRAQALAEFEEQRQALVALAENLAACRSEPPEMLASVLAEVVGRLVAQIVGETEIDPALVRERVDAVARLVTEQAGPARLRLHPADVVMLTGAALDCEIVADPALIPGSVVCETATGWIEHGPEAGMDRLRQALDQLAVAR